MELKTQIFIFKLLGLWPSEEPSTFYKLYFVFVIIFFNILHISTSVLFVIIRREQFVSFFLLFCVKVASVHKAYVFWRHADSNVGLIKDLSIPEFIPKNERQKNSAAPVLKSWRTLGYGFMVSTMGAMTLWISYPYFDRELHPRSLIINGWYPFDYKISPVYELTFIYQACSVLYVAAINVFVDVYLAGIMARLAVQCVFLCDKLENMEEYVRDRFSVNEEMDLSEGLREAFNDCLRHHRLILSLTEKLAPMINYAMFSQILASLLGFSMALFELTILSPSSSEFKANILFLIAMGVDLLLICHCGNEVSLRSAQIAVSAFACGWENGTVSMKKDLLYFMARTQRPIVIHILDFFEVSLHMFMAIIQLSYSYFTVLRGANEN